MNVEYSIYEDDENFTDAWDNFSQTISDSWDWDDDSLSLDDYKNYFDQCMIKEGMVPSKMEESVFFKKQSFLTLFLLRWT